ncbi:Alpha/beta hydrolase [Hyphomicrobium sp. 1Nfss2.1]|uniref:alpha/beta fold hydrolase n=1 Tax=Hyphomicrobium sp. 1Nfss2.1 TaxID=3413936 RepID=UPI003C7D3F85
MIQISFRVLSAMLCSAALLGPAVGPALGDAYLADLPYPYDVARVELRSQGQDLWMSYMDIAPEAPNGRTVVLLHGKNFCGATWESVIGALSGAGYRVVVPDQIGFCRSAKPRAYQYSLHQLAANTHALIEKLGIEKPIILGHSMGGMLGIRYALMYPDQTAALVLVNPIGLEDWKAKGVPLVTVDELYAREKKTSAETIKKYQQNVYYHGNWRPEYDRWVEMLASMYAGKGGDIVAWSQALTSDMVLSQPVIYEVDKLRVPTLMLIGMKDTTAIGRDRAAPDVAKTLGNYAALAPQVAAQIKGSQLVTFPELGHSPQVEDPARFNAALIQSLGALLQ